MVIIVISFSILAGIIKAPQTIQYSIKTKQATVYKYCKLSKSKV